MGKIREICNYALTINKNYKRSAPAVKVKQDHSFLKKKKKRNPPQLLQLLSEGLSVFSGRILEFKKK